MDDPGLGSAEHLAALRSLNRINRLTGVDRGLWRALRHGGQPVRTILEIGAGGGGFLKYVEDRDEATRCIGLDYSPRALGMTSRLGCNGFARLAGDARRVPLCDSSVDAVVCSLLLHHFVEGDIVAILREAARVTRRRVVIGDLTRSRTALAATWITTRLISRSRVFHVDGPLSVRAALRPGELRELAELAGMRGARVGARFPFRMTLVWDKAFT